MNDRHKSVWLIELIAAAPAVMIGVTAMFIHNVPATIYIQNLVAILLCWLFSCFVIRKNISLRGIGSRGILILVFVGYILTLLDLGIADVHRWLAIGPIRLHISSIVIPFVLIETWRLLCENKYKMATGVIFFVSIILSLQPDAAQLTAFAIPVILLVWVGMKTPLSKGIIVSQLLLIAISWYYLDSLPPVAYVEEIIGMVFNMGGVWALLGSISLILIPLPYVVFPRENHILLSRSLGLYFAVSIFATFFGNFPVPLMGYGISPIIGYFIGLTWLHKSNIKHLATK